jgi:hypothetical protein
MTEADRLRQRAEDLRAIARALQANPLLGVRQRMGPQVWQAPRADQFTDDLRRQEEALATALRHIQAAIEHLMTQADQLEMKGRAM